MQEQARLELVKFENIMVCARAYIYVSVYYAHVFHVSSMRDEQRKREGERRQLSYYSLLGGQSGIQCTHVHTHTGYHLCTIWYIVLPVVN